MKTLLNFTLVCWLTFQQTSVLITASKFAGLNSFKLAVGVSSSGKNDSNNLSMKRGQNKCVYNSNHETKNIRGGANSNGRSMTARKMKILNLLSGGVAGTIAGSLTNPLEVIKTQLQSTSASKASHGELAAAGGHPIDIAKRILAQDGIGGFWRGMKPTLVGIIPARSIYFYSYVQTKSALGKLNLPEGSVGNALISGFAAGIASNTLTNPIWMVKTRMQLLADNSVGQKAYANYGDVIQTIWKEEGVGGFYKGISASYWGCAEGCIQFILYEQIKTRLVKKQNEKREEQGLPPTNDLPKLSYFLSAAVCKGMASIATYPHEVVRTRLREQARGGVFKYHSMWQALGLIAKEEGRQGLYAGMGVHLAKVVPNSAIMFLTYELVNSWLAQFTIVDE
uniref:Mitochondrial carrier protein n=1 Tax=Eucampia antarctica TaxID=49252 RepID=A0A7S2RK71_9STRA|mmetsp:Transcript_23351/g.22411  ORF Transcript_23351/g.22411 Transcript_23351/m.22411 type:complete len:395 (+) Transcript_23351:170-1354(+)|eukprot:CAMPEP_0197827552 /NCGR_PEP_ID=MMETSP1437-20131217/4291_1 /TAXON_ID=49252 ORGANISM="Eucampia antarctica, Strain CCMP1452" /NCGR_SAMPLE_ID=MMETSP1437 /ASSEMBLY_ACC=CAM_ASM_001096 /LENGTH=394 /DNA_ID=CAMNT_0043428423 /DNA_START=161 /DNA_END=1345 /DNA_ORIENTATION=-